MPPLENSVGNESPLHIIPGDAAEKSKARRDIRENKIVVFSSSITRSIDKQQLEKDCQKGKFIFHEFKGKTAYNIVRYIDPHLIDEKPQSVMFVAGGNDLPYQRASEKHIKEIANCLIKGGLRCRNEFGVEEVFISSILPRTNLEFQENRERLNNVLRNLCSENNFKFIENKGIVSDKHIGEDRVHLNKQGTTVFHLNIVDALNETMEDMASVAPWDCHGNGFASKYMIKNGHQPGKGLGKSENGIAVPISAEKKTFQPDSPSQVWPAGTVLIAGDSMVGGLEGKKMSGSVKVQVRSHGGATINDMRDHLNALLRKRPSHLILHAHSNDASCRNTTSDDMYEELVDLKSFAESQVKDIRVTISCPILRTDNTLAHAKQIQLKNRLKRSGLVIIENDGITHDDLSRKGLHLKPSGSAKLAKNILNFLRSV
jgi:lysophospholipase L1-like esterase